MKSSTLSSELIDILKERDSYNRVIRITEVTREITNQAPFSKGWSFITRDKHLIRYLIMVLPFLENIIETVLNLLFFKFQNYKPFLLNAQDSLEDILKLPDSEDIQNELEELAGNNLLIDKQRSSKSFEDQVKLLFVLDVRINIENYKQRCLQYMKKIYAIFETNFLQEDIFEKNKEVMNPYKTIWFAFNANHNEGFKEVLMAELDLYDKTKYGKVQSEYLDLINNELRKDSEEDDDYDRITDEEMSNLPSANEDYHDGDFKEGVSDSDFKSNDLDNDDLMAEPQVKMSSQLESIHEWLFAEDVPHFTKNEFIKNLIKKDNDLEVFFNFIVSPQHYPLDVKSKKKYYKLNRNQYPDFKKTLPLETDWSYVPERHNPYYLRARRMMYVFLFKPNINSLMSFNTNFVDIFYKLVTKEVFLNPYSKANLDWVFKLMQYFLLCDIGGSIKNIIHEHIPFYLLGNIEIQSARFMQSCLITPGDSFFKLPKEELQKLYRYLKETNFHTVQVQMLVNFSFTNLQDHLIDLRSRSLKSFDFYCGDEFGGKKNPFQNIFHSFFNIKILLKHHKQPEDFANQKYNIDAVNLKKNAFQRVIRFSTMVNNTGNVSDNTTPKSRRGIEKLNAASLSNFLFSKRTRAAPPPEPVVPKNQASITNFEEDKIRAEQEKNKPSLLSQKSSKTIRESTKKKGTKFGTTVDLALNKGASNTQKVFHKSDSITEGFQNPLQKLLSSVKNGKEGTSGEQNDFGNDMESIDELDENEADNYNKEKDKQGIIAESIGILIKANRFKFEKIGHLIEEVGPCKSNSGIMKIKKKAIGIFFIKTFQVL